MNRAAGFGIIRANGTKNLRKESMKLVDMIKIQRRFAASVLHVVVAFATSSALAESWQNDEGVIRTWSSTDPLRSEATPKVVLLANTDIADVEIVSSFLNFTKWQSHAEAARCQGEAIPFFVKRTATTLTADMMVKDLLGNYYSDGFTAAIKLILYQDGNDVCGYVAGVKYAKYINAIGFDFWNPAVKLAYSVLTGYIMTPDYAKPNSYGYYYGIDQLTFSVKSTAGKKTVSHTAPVDAAASLNVGTNVSVTLGAQCFAGAASLTNRISLAPGAELVYENLANDTEVAPSANGRASSLVFRRTETEGARPNVSLRAGALNLTNGYVVVDGPLRLSITNTSPSVNAAWKTTFVPLLPPSGWFVVTNGAEFVIDSPGSNTSASYKEHRCGFRICSDSMMVMKNRNFPVDNFFMMDIDGGELRLGGENASAANYMNHFVNYVTFRNGGRMTGASPYVGYGSVGYWYVCGTTPSTCETPIRLYNANGGGRTKLNLDVDDVTGDDGVDFTFAEAIQTGYGAGGGIVKTGSGTAKFSKACTYRGPTRVNGGTLLFGADQCVYRTNEVSVAGGTLAFAAGTATTLDNFKFGAGTNRLSFASGATLSLTTVAWDENVSMVDIIGDVGMDSCLFGTNRVPATLKGKFRVNGRRATIGDDGRIAFQGMLMIVL